MSNNKIQKPKPVSKTPTKTKKRRPNELWDPEMANMAQNAWAAGMSDAAVARYLRIARSTLHKWKQERPEIQEAHMKGKEGTIVELFNAMYRKAMDGDVKAGEFLLKRLAGEIYGDKKTIEVTGEIQVRDRSDAELLEIIEKGKAIEAEVMQLSHSDIEEAVFEELSGDE